MSSIWKTVTLAAIALAFASMGMAERDNEPEVVSAADAFSRFIRVAEDKQNRPRALQLAAVTYVPREGGPSFTVDLVSAVHIGDKAYYAELNQRFRGYDVLLYELVTPEGAGVPDQDLARKGFVSNTQLGMTKALNLSFQLNEIDYSQPNFVHADLSPTELAQSMADRGDLYVYFWRVVYAAIEAAAADPLGLKDLHLMMSLVGPGGEDALKIAAAYEMTKISMLFPDGDSGTALIGARNERAVQVLKEQLGSGAKRIGIFYGAAHMPDLERRLLTDLRLARGGTTWIDAWKLGTKPLQ